MSQDTVKRVNGAAQIPPAQAFELNLTHAVCTALNGEVLLVDKTGTVKDVMHVPNLPASYRFLGEVGNIFDLPGIPRELAELALSGYPFSHFTVTGHDENLAYRFSSRPFDGKDDEKQQGIVVLLKPAIVLESAPRMNDSLVTFSSILGADSQFVVAKKRAILFAPTRKRILIQGESGTGKELFAQAIHNASRPHAPYVKVNCASLTNEHAMRLLAGFVENKRLYPGVLSTVKGGTLVLDNIDKLRLNVQPFVMQFLDEYEIAPVGGDQPITMDFRLICLSTKNVVADLGSGDVRGDLFFRMANETLDIPPLRDRKTDILPLARLIINRYCDKHGIKPIPLSTAVNEILLTYHWPGNVRELESVLNQACHLCRGGAIRSAHIRGRLLLNEEVGQDIRQQLEFPTLKSQERKRIMDAYEHAQGNVAEAAAMIGMSKTTFYRRLKEYGISKQA